jgi:hypothetical protein
MMNVVPKERLPVHNAPPAGWACVLSIVDVSSPRSMNAFQSGLAPRTPPGFFALACHESGQACPTKPPTRIAARWPVRAHGLLLLLHPSLPRTDERHVCHVCRHAFLPPWTTWRLRHSRQRLPRHHDARSSLQFGNWRTALACRTSSIWCHGPPFRTWTSPATLSIPTRSGVSSESPARAPVSIPTGCCPPPAPISSCYPCEGRGQASRSR